jgi:hypothetical protein
MVTTAPLPGALAAPSPIVLNATTYANILVPIVRLNGEFINAVTGKIHCNV